ncbi:LysE family translocator [Microtetraspora sp. NBRC 16547]|uniref:LysE family translocator n=1 Tax=Microtetraspora sp. NBRC 16547 TaxID=3030993 RepID=UPI0024A33214|nr:LysE family translocator [Microtetraspora sp. NBRC 16547]GLX00018.1 lysine transporter LysE [Microtetraspora sp. NBRC 16547]
MTVFSALASFAVVAGLMTIVPGLDTALVLRSAITGGRRQAFATALGVNTGVLVWGAGAAVGVSALLTASQTAYTVLRLAGAAYLVWFGATMVLRTLRGRAATSNAVTTNSVTTTTDEAGRTEAAGGAVAPGTSPETGPETGLVTGPGGAWARGLVTNLLNPKVGVFYVAMLPQFIPADAPHLLTGLLLALVHNVEGMAWFTLLIFGTHLARAWLSGARVHRVIDRVTGAVLVGFGLRLALSGNQV